MLWPTDRHVETHWTTQNGALNLRYSGPLQVCVRGPVTGSVYKFSPAQPVISVDERDAQSLLSSRLFSPSQ